MNWPADNEPVDPAFAPLIEAGQGEAEGFELAEKDLVRHATQSDLQSSARILLDADTRDEEATGAIYGEADAENHPDA